MNTDSKNPSSPQSDVSPMSRLFDDWVDPIETGVRARVRDWIEALIHSELDTALQRPRYGRSTGGETEPAVAPVRGYRIGSRTRTLTGTFGKTDITVPRARLQGADGVTTEWKSKALRAYQRRTKARIKTQTVLPSADTAAMLFWALLASGQIVMRKIDGWNTLSTVSSDQQKLDAAA